MSLRVHMDNYFIMDKSAYDEFEYIVYPSDKGFKTQRKSVEKVDRKLTIDRNISQRMNVSGDCDATHIPQVNDFF